jgi:hypothetical protein
VMPSERGRSKRVSSTATSSRHKKHQRYGIRLALVASPECLEHLDLHLT